MARQSWIYKDIGGIVRAIPTTRGTVKVPGMNDPNADLETRMQRSLYHLECEKGSRFRVPADNGQSYSKSLLKKMWGT